MLQKVRELRRQASGARAAGFTIIEVMIVLAIAGVIMGIVFLAIPNLQRSNRNTQRKDDASRLSGLISEYGASNNGRLPASIAAAAAANTLAIPATTKWSIVASPVQTIITLPTTVPTPAADTLVVYTTAVCGAAGDSVPVAGTSARQYVIYWSQEGSPATQCLGA